MKLCRNGRARKTHTTTVPSTGESWERGEKLVGPARLGGCEEPGGKNPGQRENFPIQGASGGQMG